MDEIIAELYEMKNIFDITMKELSHQRNINGAQFANINSLITETKELTIQLGIAETKLAKVTQDLKEADALNKKLVEINVEMSQYYRAKENKEF